MITIDRNAQPGTAPRLLSEVGTPALGAAHWQQRRLLHQCIGQLPGVYCVAAWRPSCGSRGTTRPIRVGKTNGRHFWQPHSGRRASYTASNTCTPNEDARGLPLLVENKLDSRFLDCFSHRLDIVRDRRSWPYRPYAGSDHRPGFPAIYRQNRRMLGNRALFCDSEAEPDAD